MAQKHASLSFAARLFSGAALSALAAGGAAAQSTDDVIIVTSQRTEQSLQDVPIAVSAFSESDLQDRQLESAQDIQFNIPNFQFTRTQFTSSSVAIRGIGNFLTASSSEDAVSTHMNDVFLAAPRLFETEFFDVERLEILRGPQGTLFGRNATGGVINVITAKADPSDIGGYIDAEYGNYDSIKAQGALNLPLTDTLAVRLAGTTIQRDGYTKNVWTGQNIDDRDIYSIRGSVRWLPTENTTVDFTASYMSEDDNRMRWQKQACKTGGYSPLLGCDTSGARAFDPVDLRGTIAANISSEAFATLSTLLGGSPADAAAAGAFGLYSLASGPVTGVAQPADMRRVAFDTDPKYDAEETIFLLNIKHDFENFSVKINGGWGNSKIATRTDYDGGVGPELTPPAALAALPGVYPLYADGTFPMSAFDIGAGGALDGLVGVIGGREQGRSNRYISTDLSFGEHKYWSAEGIVSTDFDSRFNFLLGVNHLKDEGDSDYAVATSGLDYFSIVGGTLTAMSGAASEAAAAVLGAGGSPADAATAADAAASSAAATGYSFYVPYFYGDTNGGFLDSTSVFGEIYVDLTDTLKLTGGVRHNWDTKGLRDRNNLLDSFVALASGTLPAGAAPVVPLGTTSVRPLLDADETVGGTSGAVNDYRVAKSDFNSTTGRAVLQWAPSDDVQYYLSWSRGYKPGGFNPPTLAGGVAPTFDPEIINAYEAGVKSVLASGALRANLTGFYYDYSGLQVSRVIARTSFNENVNATVWGLEGEFVWKPTDAFTANLNASYLNAKVGDFSAFDPHNPTASRDDVELVADIITGSNCVVTRAAADGPLLIADGGTPTGVSAIDAIIASPYSVCNALADNIAAINLLTGGGYSIADGIEQSLKGNRLLGAPEFKISGGVEYEFALGSHYVATPRVDAYYQSKMYTSNFNTEQDLVDGYAVVNAQLRFAPRDGNWYVRAFVQNVTDNDAITGAFRADQSAGATQNLFLLEPRRWGFGVGMNF